MNSIPRQSCLDPRSSAFIRGQYAFRGCQIGGWLMLAAMAALIGGCAGADAVSTGRSTALDGIDLVTMTDDMAARIVADPDVQTAIALEGKLRVVVQPVENQMVGEVLPPGRAETFTVRVRALLSKAAPESFTWIMNRDAFYRLRGRELDVHLGPSPDAIDPKYALQARFSSLTDESSKARSSYYLCVYEMTDLETRKVLWTGRYEVKKTAVKGFLD